MAEGMILQDCHLIEPREGHCWVAGCDQPLGKRRRRWCSDEHGNFAFRQHAWTAARVVALKRDNYTCQMCGFHTTNTGPPPTGTRFHDKEPWDNWLEVNHIEPRRGGGYASGCWNHWDNLQTLCHQCHVRVTCEQQGWIPAADRDKRRMERLEQVQAKYIAPWPGMPAGGAGRMVEKNG